MVADAGNPINFDLYELQVFPVECITDQITILKLDLRNKTNNILKYANLNNTLDYTFSLGLKCNVQWTKLLFWNHVCVSYE